MTYIPESFVNEYEKFKYLRNFATPIQMYPKLNGSALTQTNIVKVGGSITITDVNISKRRISAKIGTFFGYSASGYYSYTYYRINNGDWVLGHSAEMANAWRYTTLTGFESIINTGDVIEIGVKNDGDFPPKILMGSIELLLTDIEETILVQNE